MKLQHVYCVGMSRSGGTLQFQIVREIMARYAPNVKVTKNEIYREKVSASIDNDSNKGVGIYRDFRDVVVSLRGFYTRRAKYYKSNPDQLTREKKGKPAFTDESYWTFENTLADAVKNTLTWQKGWEENENIYFVRYEDIWPGSLWDIETANVAHFCLGYYIKPKDAVEIASKYNILENIDRIDFMKKWFDAPGSFLTKGHIGVACGRPELWRTALTDDQVLAIEEIAGEWLVSHGYRLASG